MLTLIKNYFKYNKNTFVISLIYIIIISAQNQPIFFSVIVLLMSTANIDYEYKNNIDIRNYLYPISDEKIVLSKYLYSLITITIFFLGAYVARLRAYINEDFLLYYSFGIIGISIILPFKQNVRYYKEVEGGLSLELVISGVLWFFLLLIVFNLSSKYKINYILILIPALLFGYKSYKYAVKRYKVYR